MRELDASSLASDPSSSGVLTLFLRSNDIGCPGRMCARAPARHRGKRERVRRCPSCLSLVAEAEEMKVHGRPCSVLPKSMPPERVLRLTLSSKLACSLLKVLADLLCPAVLWLGVGEHARGPGRAAPVALELAGHVRQIWTSQWRHTTGEGEGGSVSDGRGRRGRAQTERRAFGREAEGRTSSPSARHRLNSTPEHMDETRPRAYMDQLNSSGTGDLKG